jgi:hypothetical protein
LNQLKCMVPYALPPNQIFFFKQNWFANVITLHGERKKLLLDFFGRI